MIGFKSPKIIIGGFMKKNSIGFNLYEEYFNTSQLTEEDFKKLVKDYQQSKDEKVKEKLLKANFKLVVHIYDLHFSQYFKEREDLIQEGLIACFNAIEKFDLNKNYKFSTYAYPLIKFAMDDYMKSLRYIQLPKNKWEELVRFWDARNKISKEKCGEPTLEELVEELNFSKEKIENLKSLSHNPISLNRFITNESKEESLALFLEDPTVNIEEDIADKSKNEFLKKLIDFLPLKERYIIYIRYGWYNGHECSLEDTGKILYKLGITKEIMNRESVRQAEKKIFVALKSPNILRMLGYDIKEDKTKFKNNLEVHLLKSLREEGKKIL